MKAPWKTIKEDRDSAGLAISTALGVISCLKTVLYPFLPFSSEKLHSLLDQEGSVRDAGWAIHVPRPGQKLSPPEPLFAKLDDGVVDEENRRLEEYALSPG
jgi:methionyl-tRNA synthetase